MNKSIKYDKLQNIKQFIDTESTLLKTYSKLGNLKISETNSGIKISGSIPYYYWGNNIETLRKIDMKFAIQKLQEDLGINLLEANVYRIDFASNFIMNHPYENYFDSLINAPYTVRGNIDKSLYFGNKLRQLCFYGKLVEAKEKKLYIPDKYRQYENTMLRYELRIKKNVKEQLNQRVKLKNLTENEFFSDMVLRWKGNYDSIKKQQRILLNENAYKTPKQLIEHLAVSQINEKGIDAVFNNLTANKSRFRNSVEVCRARNRISELLNDKTYSEPNELIEELDQKVSETAEFYLQN